jgi:hypothetical protein
MKGKHRNRLVHAAATIRREWLRSRMANLVEWEPLVDPDDGCTAIIGVCSKLPDILMANLRCLQAARWPELKRAILVVDCEKSAFPISIEQNVIPAFPELNIKFVYYSAAQFRFAESHKLPHLYAWLSWCIALKHTTTSHVLIHDYDALVFGPELGTRYRSFAASGAKVQGIAWYSGNGVEKDDHLATTFEAFLDTAWLRSSEPLALFNKTRAIRGRSIDFDTMLDVQYRSLRAEQRTIMPMTLSELIHPSQMICQYTTFRRSPAAALPCFSIPMIPFFCYLSGRPDAVQRATQVLGRAPRDRLDLLGDGTCINLAMLTTEQVNWVLKNIVQACVALSLEPDHGIYLYGQALYRVSETPTGGIWAGDFTEAQRAWIYAARPPEAQVPDEVG